MKANVNIKERDGRYMIDITLPNDDLITITVFEKNSVIYINASEKKITIIPCVSNEICIKLV